MVYLTVKEESEERLHFTRQPSLNSWAVLVGFSSVGLGIAYYGNDPLWLKAIYIVLGSLIGISCMEDWEECDFDKKAGEVRLKKQSAWDLIFLRQEDVVIAQLSEISGTTVQEEKVNFFGNTYQVVITFSTGMTIGITDSFTFGSSKEHYGIAEKIRNFLNIDEAVTADNDFVDSSSSEGEDTADDFEHIDQSDIVDETDKMSSPQTEDKTDDVQPTKDDSTENE